MKNTNTYRIEIAATSAAVRVYKSRRWAAKQLMKIAQTGHAARLVIETPRTRLDEKLRALGVL